MRLCRKPAMLFFLVIAAVTGAASQVRAGEPARITLGYSNDDHGLLLVTARVMDKADAPVAGVVVTFQARTAFGWLKLAEPETGRDGRVTVSLPAQRIPEVAARTGDAGGIRASLALPRVDDPVPMVRPGRDVLRTLSPQPGLISPYPPAQLILVAALLAGVWSTYGYVILLLTRLRASR